MKILTGAKLAAAVGAVVALIVLAGECRDWLSKKPRVTYKPETGRLTAEAQKWPSSLQTVEVKMPELPPAEVDRIGKKYGRTDLVGGDLKADPPSRAKKGGASSPAGAGSESAGGVAGVWQSSGLPPVPGSKVGRARTLGEWTFVSPDGECAVDVVGFLELDRSVTTKHLWTNTPADNPKQSFLGAPLSWRLTVGGTAWPKTAAFAALGFRTLRVNRIELSPAVMGGYDFSAGGAAWGGVGAVGTFDF